MPLLLRELAPGARLGISGAVLCLLLGLWASLGHLVEHHQGRDGEPGVSIDDLRGAYHGVRVRAPLAAALERGHPEALADPERRSLLAWLASDRLSEGYDDPDRGAEAPAEILARNCLACHARESAGEDAAADLPLEYWDDVAKLAHAREISAVPREILLSSTHAHAPALALLTLAVGLLLAATRWPAPLRSGLFGLAGAALALDLGGWWLAREMSAAVWLLAAAGAAWAAAIAAGCLLVLADLWLPAGKRVA